MQILARTKATLLLGREVKKETWFYLKKNICNTIFQLANSIINKRRRKKSQHFWNVANWEGQYFIIWKTFLKPTGKKRKRKFNDFEVLPAENSFCDFITEGWFYAISQLWNMPSPFGAKPSRLPNSQRCCVATFIDCKNKGILKRDVGPSSLRFDNLLQLKN